MIFKMPFTDKNFSQVNETFSTGGENTKNGVNTKKTKKDDLLKQLEELKILAENALDDAVNKEFNSEYLKKDEKSDEQIKKLVEDRAAIDKQEKIDKMNEDLAAAQEKITQTKQNQEIQKQDEIKNVDKAYDQAKQDAQDQAIKRGLQRSSVIMNLLKDYDQGKFAKQGEIDKKYDDKAKELDRQIEKLDADLAASLKKLDFETAINVQNQIEKLKAERDEKNAQVVKYNNEIKDKIANYKKNLEHSEYGKKILNEVEEKQNAYYRKMTDKIIEYYSTLSDSEMLEDYLSSDYDKILGAAGQKLLRTYVNTRQKNA